MGGVVAGKFQMRSRKWDVASVVGALLLFAFGFGGLFVLRGALTPGTAVTLFLVLLGIVTFLFFAGPGIVYSARKRIGVVKKAMPGGTMAWIRAHLYLPVFAMVAAFVHASSAPFRDQLSSGKLTLVLSVLVVISGWARHHMIGVQKEALNVDVAIAKIAAKQERGFRTLVTDFLENRRPLGEIEQQVAAMGDDERRAWGEIRSLSESVEKHFPRTGGQTMLVRQYKVWKALHPPLTIALFVLLAYHVFDVFGGGQVVLGDEKTAFASAQQCADCHSTIFEEWARSPMAHAQTSSIMEAQLPVTIQKNLDLAEELGGTTAEIVGASAKACINCHAPIGARFAGDNIDLLPFGAKGSDADGQGAAVSGGGDQVQKDGVSCVACHTQVKPPREREGFGVLTIDNGGAGDFGTIYGPLLDDPVPVRVHGIETGDDGWWNDPISGSRLCAACHNVKADMDGDDIGPSSDEDNTLDFVNGADSDGDNQLDQNELDTQPDGKLDDLILQTTYDEWQDYVSSYDEVWKDKVEGGRALGCAECHMPLVGDGTGPVVDYAPGVNPIPERTRRSHSFVAVDYELDKKKYRSEEAFTDALAERKAFLQSSVALEVENVGEIEDGLFGANVTVRNNGLGHAFPTGFSFARQFWLEVRAEANGEEVCLANPAEGVESPCASGDVDDPTEDLRQCETESVEQAVGQDIRGAVQSNNEEAEVEFGASFPADDCDPWLTNFQKILTDGDPDGDGVFTEVPYQSFLPDIVKTRVRVADQQIMAALESTRLKPNAETGELEERTAASFPYVFEVPEGVDPKDIVVTATMRFRHLPPYFIRALDAEHDEIERVPDEARIDPDALLKNMVIDELVTAESDEGPQIGCEGPQNGALTVFSCLEEEPGAGEEASAQAAETVAFASGVAAIGPVTLRESNAWIAWLVILASLSAASALLLLRFRPRRG